MTRRGCRRGAGFGLSGWCLVLLGSACRREPSENVVPAPASTAVASAKIAAPEPSASTGSARKGMVWVPPGTLIAGTPPSQSPRITDEELPGTPTEMGGFYIDIHPYPNEPGAIPTTNVSRDDAAARCEREGKRLCSELEWERACKGPDNTTYEYGNGYRASTCGTGVALERSATRSNGELPACRSGFGAMDLHGGALEWTSSSWEGRKAGETGYGVLRGGNAVLGELAGRCANALARPLGTRHATIGFRCCAGEPNDASVRLAADSRAPFERSSNVRVNTAGLAAQPRAVWGSEQPLSIDWLRTFFWRPVAHEELIVTSGCEHRNHGPYSRCGVVVFRQPPAEQDGAPLPEPTVLAHFGTGPRIPDLIPGSDNTKLRARSMDVRGTFAVDFNYVLGRVNVATELRP